VADPFMTMLLNSGKIRDFGSAAYPVHSDIRLAAYAATQRWLDRNGDLARRFQQAYYRSADFVMKNQDKHGEWEVKYFRLKPELKDQVVRAHFEDVGMGAEFIASLRKTRDLMLKYKFLKSTMEPEAVIFR
jgi:ABC-type nitrate/sulfonate/bicarbonate transport system substrate-binding protein